MGVVLDGQNGGERASYKVRVEWLLLWMEVWRVILLWFDVVKF